MPNSIEFYKEIFLDAILVRIIVPWLDYKKIKSRELQVENRLLKVSVNFHYASFSVEMTGVMQWEAKN